MQMPTLAPRRGTAGARRYKTTIRIAAGLLQFVFNFSRKQRISGLTIRPKPGDYKWASLNSNCRSFALQACWRPCGSRYSLSSCGDGVWAHSEGVAGVPWLARARPQNYFQSSEKSVTHCTYHFEILKISHTRNSGIQYGAPLRGAS